MNRKEILTIFILLICVIFSLQAVSAVDSGSNSTDGNVLSVDNVSSYALPNSESNGLVGNANEGSFTELQGILNGGSEITLTKNYTYMDTDVSLGNKGIIISGTKVINGNGNVIIDASHKSRIFIIAQNANVTLKGITFVNANSTVLPNGDQTGHGGSIFANGEVHIDNCNFIDNTATYGNGAGVFIRGSGSTITNSYFKGNIALNNGNDGIGAGAAVFMVDANNVKISHSTFVDNYAGLNGGAIASKDGFTNCTIINCTFEHNTANGSAGAVGMQGTNFKMYNSTFKYNEARGLFDVVGTTPYYPGNGGGIVVRAHDSYVYNTTFISNTAKLYGGGSFLTNTSTDPTNNNTKYELCTFINNTAGSNGGALYWVKGAHYGYVLNSTFTNNTANRSGGAVYWFGTIGTIKYSNFTNNTALGIKEDKDSYGSMTYGGNGGAIMWVGSEGTVYNCTFTTNDASNKGGAVYLQGSSEGLCNNTQFDTCTFTGNVAGVNGGAIDWYRGARNGHILNSVFEDNIANRSGGAVFWSGIGGEIKYSNFTNNTALGIKEANDTYGNMTYGGYGGAVMWTGPNGTIDDCRFISNEAKYNEATNSGGRGGAIYLQGSATDNCTNTTFSNCNFTSNIAGTNGGAIDWHEGAHDGKIINSTFNNNIANANGGAIYWRGHNGNITYSNFTNNTAKGVHPGTYGNVGDGGAIFWAGINGDVDNCRFVENEAKRNDDYVTGGRGGAVYLDRCSHGNKNTTFWNVYFENNIAGTNGGAIDWHDGAEDGLVDNATFINNTAKRNGGAIFWHGQNGTIKNSRFTNNRATGTEWEYTFDLNMGTSIVVQNNGNLVLGNIYVIQNSTLPTVTPTSNDVNKLFVLNYTNGTKKVFKSYVAHNNGTGLIWLKLDETTIDISESIISPVDWAIDQYYGGDGGSILWSGDIGLVYNCSFTDSNSARRGGGAYMTGSDNVTYNLCNFTNSTSGTNGGGVDWLAGANYGKIYNCIFNNTRAARSAGAIYYDGWYGDMQNITIINTTSYGGALKQSKDKLVNYAGWDSSHWDTNTTGGDAGAIMFTGSFIDVYNVTFTNCTASGRGGAVFLQDNHNVAFDLCTFENNRALGTANNTYTNDKDVTSRLNKWNTGHGGAIGFDIGATNGTIKNSKFFNNTAARDGGAIFFAFGSINGTIYNSTFDNNTAKRNGGAFCWDGTGGNVTYCNFTGNKALGVVISTEYAVLTSLDDVINVTGADAYDLDQPSTATDNKLYVLVIYDGTKKAKYELYVSQVTDSHFWLKIDETTETGPSPIDWAVDEYFGGDGGSIYWGGDNGTIDNCKFIDSDSARRGGGAYMTGGDHVNYYNCTFENCTSGTNGGGLDWLAGANYGKVIDCNFTHTEAARSAGAIYYDGDYGEFRNIIIKNTTAHGGDITQNKDGKVKYAGWDSSHWDTNTTGGDGGAIMFTGDHIKVYNANITDCTAVGRGGAVFLQDNDNVTFELCRFENNRALGTANNTFNDPHDTSSGLNKDLTGHGGAISFDIDASQSSIINSTFINNTAKNFGGAVHFREGASEDKIINSTFEKNYVDEDGGALYIDGTNCELHNSTFTDNYAGDDGGAIFWQGDAGIIYNITCVNNSGVSTHGNSKGGTICLNGNNISLSNSSFKQSYAKVTGGALFVTGNYVNITGSEFDDCNVTTETGGAIQILGDYVQVRDSTFNECHAPDGGAIYVEGEHVKIIGSEFTNNNITKDGAALYVKGDYAELHNSTFNDNVAGDDGGAIYWEGSHGTIYNITCENNSGISAGDSNSNGGTICLTGGDVTLSESSFKDSFAGADGGAIFVTGDDVTIMTTNFENCTSVEEGGAIYILGHDTTITDCTFEECNATQGGAIYVEGDRATISVNITDTHALGADSYVKTVDYKFFKDNVKEIKYDIDDLIKYVLTIKTGNVIGEDITDENVTCLNSTLRDLYNAVDNVLNDNGINSTNVTIALDIISKLNANLTQLNSTLNPGGAKNITLKLISDLETIEKELNYVLEVSQSLETPANITAEIDGMIKVLDEFTPTSEITADNITTLKSDLIKINDTVKGIFNNSLFNLTNITLALSLLDEFNQTLHTIDANNVLGLSDDVEKIAKELRNISTVSDTLVVPEVIAQGGAIYISGNEALIDGSIINSTDAVYGGGLYITGHDVKVDNSVFMNLYSVEDGGAIDIAGQGGKLYNSKFINNTAGDDGGAINWDGNQGKIYNITCENNKGISLNGSSSNGGTISLTGNDTSIEKSSFTQTYALIAGGAIFVTGNNVNITDTEFKDCNVSMDIAETNKSYANGGGAIYVLGNYSNIINCTFDDSEAREGGAIYVQGHDVKVDKSNFTDSIALNGGTIYIDGDHAIVMGCILNDTVAGSDSHTLLDENLDVSAFQDALSGKGGAIYIKSENAQILDSTITLSNATYEGGAIYVEGNNATISVDFIDCGAGFPAIWVTPDINLFKSPINDILIKVNGLISYNNDVHNGFSDNFSDIYNSMSSIRTNLVKNIFIDRHLNEDNLRYAIGNLTELNDALPNMVTDSVLLDTLDLSSYIALLSDIDSDDYNKYYNSKVKTVYDGLNTKMNYVNMLGYDNSYLYTRLNAIKTNLVDKIFTKSNNVYVFNAANLNAAIGNLTEVYDCVKFAEKDGSYEEFLNNLSIIISNLKSIPSDATYNGYYSVSKAASDSILSLRDYSRNVKNSYVSYKNNLNALRNNLNKLNQQTTLKTFNNVMYDVMVNIADIKANLNLLLDVYAGSDFTELSDNFTYVKSQLGLIQNAAESLQNMGIKGGAIYVAGNDTNITGSTFLRCLVGNALKGEGGAIYINGVNTTITESDFMNCSAPDNGGSIYIDGKNALVEKSTFNKTSSEYRGGAIYIEGFNATVKDSNFTDSTVTGGKYENTNPRGGAIYINENNATIEGSIFNNSSVSTTVGEGGTVYIEGDYTRILSSEFETSKAFIGGTIFLEGDHCTVSDSSFNDSHTLNREGHGGAMYSTGSNSRVYASNFTNNDAEGNGGAIFWYGGDSSRNNVVDDCIFINNTAKANTYQLNTKGGGAVYWSEGGYYGTVKNSKFYNNSVVSSINHKADGGAILWDKSLHALVDNCIFIGDYVFTTGDQNNGIWAQGGAMYLRPNANYTIRDSLFENCYSSKEGGALYMQSADGSVPGNVLVENTKFINNTAQGIGKYEIFGGGAVMIKQIRTVDFKNVSFINNTANVGGALSVYKVYGNAKTFDQCTFENNTATEMGGAIYILEGNDKVLYVTNSNFTYNKAVKGSAIYAEKSFYLTNVELLKNRANTSSLDMAFSRPDGTLDLTLKGWDNYLNAMYITKGNTAYCSNVKYWTDDTKLSGTEAITSQSQSGLEAEPTLEKGISLTVELFDANNNKLNVGNDIFATDAIGELHLTPNDFDGITSFENVYVKARLTNEDYYTQVEVTTRLPSSMEATAHNVTYHRNATVNVTITPSTGLPAATGIVSVYYGDVFLGNISVTNNKGISDEILTNITADRFLEVGTHNLTLKYWGDLYNDEINITVPINVTKAQSNITIVAFNEIGYNLFINVTIVDDWDGKYYADATGNVTLNVYGKDLTTPIQSKVVYLTNGTGVTFFDLLPANYTIKAVYDGDKNYNASINSTTVELHHKQDIRILIDINATAGDIMVDETVYINITILTPEGFEATGNVTLYLDNEKYSLSLTDSKVQFNKTGLPAGHKIVTVCYDGSKDLQANYGDAEFNVLKYNTTFTIGVTNITHNQTEVINITFLNETEGVVYIYVNGGNYSAIINNCTAILELSNLTVGEHNVTVKFPGDWKFNNVTNMTRFYVKQVTPDVIIDVDNVTYGNPTNIVIKVPDCVSGNVSIKINGTPYGDPKLIDNGKVEFDVGILAAGNYTVEAIYSGDTNHTSARYKQNFTVYKANRTIDIEVKDIVYGDVEHIEVYVNASGNVTITVNGKSETIVLNESGKASLDVYNLSAKTYTVDVTYNGNDNYTKSSASKTFTVSQMATSLDVKVHDVPIRGMEYINITVMNSTGGVATNLNGTLTINIDGVDRKANIINGTATFNTTEFNNAVGKRVVWVFFEGDVNFKESRAMKTYKVTQRTLTENDLNVTAQNITVGQTGNVTVNLPKDITGYVVIEIEAYNGYRDDTYYKEVNNGEAFVYPEDLREGTYHVYVTYKGTDYKPRFAETLFTVSKIKVNVTIDVNDTVYDNTSDIVVYVDDGVEGAITIKINNTLIGTFAIVDGKVNTTVKLGAGKYTVYAEYEGNYKYNANKTESKSFTVEKATPAITIDPVTVDANTSAVIVVHINDTATGTINITVNKQNYTADIIDGVATFDMIPVLPAGIYNVTANYYALSDTNYTEGSKYIEVGVTVTKIKCYPMNVSAENITVGQNTNITVNVPDGATGYVIIWVNGTDHINRTIVDGEVKFSLGDNLKEGVYVVNATLIDDNYENRVVTTFFTVSKVDTPISILVTEPVYVNDTAVITVTVPDGIKDIVTIEINGESYNNKSVEGNKVIFEVSNITYGNKTVVAIYGGDDKFRSNYTTENFTVHKRNSFINVNATNGVVDGEVIINVTVPERATGYVIVNVNGTNYTINLTKGDDRVAVKVTKDGPYNVTVAYIGDDQFLPNTNNTNFTVSKLDTDVIIDVKDTVYDKDVNIVVYVDEGVEGSITLSLNTTSLGTYGIVGGKVNITIDNPGVDNYVVYAVYNGNYKYNVNDTASKKFSVTKATPVIVIDKVTVDANTNATVIVHINDTATGTINITVNGKPYEAIINDGIAEFTVDILPVGKYDITANYNALTDTNYTVNSTTLVKGLNVTKVKCYPMNVSTVDVKSGENTTITVYVPGDATGKVFIDVNGTKLNKTVSGGKAVFNVTKDIAGRYVVNATLSDPKYANKTIIANYYVSHRDTPLSIDVTEPVYVNDTAVITVTVPDGIENQITIEINGETYTNKSVSGNDVIFEVPNITYGNKTVVAIYGGDDKFAYNSTTKNFTVHKRDSFINVTASEGVTVDGEAIINVTVPANAIGYVVVNVNGTNYTINLTAGEDRVAVKVTEAGLYNVTVTYIGDDQYLPSSNNTNFTVSKITPFINATVINDGIISNGSDVNITIHAPSDITGKVNVTVWDMDRDINTTYTVYVNEGTGTLPLEAPAIGKYNVTVRYLENRKYLENRNYTTFEVYNNEKELIVLPGDIYVFETKTVNVILSGDQTGKYLTVIITNASGEVMRNESVLIKDYISSTFTNFSSAYWTLPLLDAGSYDVKAIYIENAGPRTYIHEGSSSFNVYKRASQITINEIKNTTVGNNVTIELELTPGATGNISVFVNGLEHKTTADNLTFIIPGLGADEYVVKALYYGDKNYNASNDTSAFRVDKNTVPLSISTANLGDVEQINVTVGNNATGQILLDIEDNHYYANITNGVAQFNITGIKAGKHNVTATYIENNKYYGNTTNSSFTISKYQPEFTINGTDIDVGGIELIKFETKDDITSLVTVEVNDRNYTTFIKDGKGNLTLANLEAGSYNITLYFPASDKYEAATANNTFNVRQITPDIHIDVQNITYGEVETITVFVNAEGNVTIKVGDQEFKERPIVDGIVTVDVPGLDANNYTANVTYNGNVNFTANNLKANFTVKKADPIISVEVENIVYGNVEYIVVHVNARGNVTIRINGTDINETISLENGQKVIKLMASRWNVPKYDGKASLDVHNLAVGTYDVTVTYNGNENYNTATATAEFNVTKAESPIRLDADTYIKVGDNATITVELPENATGNVTVEIDGVKYTSDNITDGVVKFTIKNLTYGNKTVAITYSGDGNHSANFTTSKLIVDKYASTVNATITPAIDVGENPVITVEVPQNATGYVIVKINNESYAIKVNNGTGSATIKGLASGDYPINVTYLGDDKYFASNSTSSIKVSKVPSTVNVTVQNITVGDKAVINISTPADLCGNVTVSVNGDNHTVYVSGGHGTLVLEDLGVGNYTVDAIFDGCRKYEPSNDTAKFEVAPVEVGEIKVIDQGNGTITIVAPGIENGNVTVKVGNETYNVTVINGTANVDLVNNTPGTYNVTVIYDGDDTHAPATVEGNVTVPKYPSEIKLDAPKITEGEPAIITVEVPAGATGNVTVVIDGKEYPAEVKNSVAVVTIDGLTAGNKTYVVKYSGDGNFSDAYAIGNLTVAKAKEVPDMNIIDYGNGTVVVVVGDNATGNVTIKLGDKEFNATVVNGTAVVTLDNITPGTHEVEVIYSGDDTHTNSTVPATITVPKYDSPMNITVGEAKEGEPIVITVEVPAGATGDVIVYVGGENHTASVDPETGKAIVTVENVSAGNHTIAVEYVGDDNYSSNYAISNMTVDKAKVESDLTVVDYGNGTVVVVVGDNATGNVTVTVDGQNYTADVINGTAVVTLNNITPGTHEVEVIYSGDDTHTNATASTVVNGPKYDSSINVTVGEAKEGEPTVITVKVPENATGNVTVTVDGQKYSAEIKDGEAIVKVENLTAGDKSVIVEYPGDDNYGGNYTIYDFTVEKAKSNPDIKVIDQGNGTIVVIVGDNATGNVTVTVDGQNYTADVINGTAVVTLNNATPGTHDIEVIYSGDDTHNATTKDATIRVGEQDAPITVDVKDIYVGDTATITVNVPENATGEITIEINGKSYTKNITDGKATFTVDDLAAGNKTVSVIYEGDEYYTHNATTTQFKVFKRSSAINATIKDSNVGENVTITAYGPKDATGQVLIDIDGVGYYVNLTNGSGTAQIPRIPSGIYNVNLAYMGDDRYIGSSNVSKFNVNKVKSFVIPIAHDIYVGELETIRVSVPTDATGNVTLVIDGEEYNFNIDTGALSTPYNDGDKYSVAVSGGNGEIVISGLPKGEYTVSARYNGDAKYLPCVNTTTFKVIKVESNIQVIDQNNGTVVVRVPCDATGNITIKLGNDTYTGIIENGTAVIDLGNATPGVHDIEVTYSGDGEYLPKTINSTVEIPKKNTPISVEANDIYVGDVEVITVTLPDDATGNVTIEIDGKKYSSTIKDGNATFEVEGMLSGEKTVAVKYPGDSKYGENATTGQFTVSKVPSNVKAAAKDITSGKTETITVTVPKDATGKVLIEIDGVGYYGDIVNGKAKILIPNIAAGKYAGKVTYEGDEKYLSSTTSVSFTVSKAKAPISAIGDEIKVGESGTVVVKLPEDATGTVTITIDGKTYTEKVENGQAIFVVSDLAVGEYKVTVYYSGDVKYPSNTTVTKIIVDGDHSDNDENSEGISLSTYSTGNPIFVILLILIALGSTQLRRFRK